jgi:5-methylcytosine-specific restriction protein B
MLSALSLLYTSERVAESGHEPSDNKVVDKSWLVDRTLWLAEDLDEVLAVLEGPNPQVILSGPPGTGKSWIALAIAEYLTSKDHRRWRLVQFHPSYGYESFIEGLRPTITEDGAVNFELIEGILVRMAKAARLNSNMHVLVLDEMNRANVPRVLGELMFLFEYRDEMIDLQYSPGFTLPKNLSFVATMNTADRSIRSIDTALRRRFEIFECLPSPDILGRYYELGRGVNQVPDLKEGFVALNTLLEEKLDRHHTIGQTFFMAKEMDAGLLQRIWERKVKPLIEEYFFDLPDFANQFTLPKFWPSADA